MEKEIIFVNLKEIESKKQNKKFYIITYLCDKESLTDYIPEELYNALLKTQLVYLKHYKGIFDFNISTRRLSLSGVTAI